MADFSILSHARKSSGSRKKNDDRGGQHIGGFTDVDLGSDDEGASMILGGASTTGANDTSDWYSSQDSYPASAYPQSKPTGSPLPAHQSAQMQNNNLLDLDDMPPKLVNAGVSGSPVEVFNMSPEAKKTHKTSESGGGRSSWFGFGGGGGGSNGSPDVQSTAHPTPNTTQSSGLPTPNIDMSFYDEEEEDDLLLR